MYEELIAKIYQTRSVTFADDVQIVPVIASPSNVLIGEEQSSDTIICNCCFDRFSVASDGEYTLEPYIVYRLLHGR